MNAKYEKPKIMLLDLPSSYEKSLRDEGYNVAVGSFGTPFKVGASAQCYHVTADSCELPNFEEQEILVIDTAIPKAIEKSMEPPASGVSAIWQSAVDGTIDPRPLVMMSVQSAFDRILANGGIAIVLLSPRYVVHYVRAEGGHQRIYEEDNFDISNWSFLTQLEELSTGKSHGHEIFFTQESPDFAALLKRGATGASYECTVTPEFHDEEHWIPLARNKYGDCVASVRMSSDGKPSIVVLPRMPKFHSILPDLIANWCFEWRPNLFPFHQGGTWLHADRYELPEIKGLQNEIDRIEKESSARISGLHAEIQDVRGKNKDWYTLLNGTGDELVSAVIRGLQKIGFKKVIDVDEQARTNGKTGNLREDIQIQDCAPVLIIDVKGITGCVEDSEATQSEKHALMRAKEFQGNVKPLTIVNHQRNIPPHDRNSNPYREEIVENAMQTGLGLMTTWDLFLLLRNKELLDWADDMVKPIFYRTGRIEPIPDHYTEIGQIVRVWREAFGIIPNRTITVGNRLAVMIEDHFSEFAVKSLKVENVSVVEGPAGSNCGIEFDSSMHSFKKGMRVFVVTARNSNP